MMVLYWSLKSTGIALLFRAQEKWMLFSRMLNVFVFDAHLCTKPTSNNT